MPRSGADARRRLQQAALELFRERGYEATTAAEIAAVEEAMLLAFRSVERTIENNRPITEPRRAVIAQTPALQERVLTKTAGLTDALSEALSRRGVERGLAMLAAQVGMAAFACATRAWFYEPEPGLDAHLTRAFAELRSLSSARGNLKPRAARG